MRKTPMPTTDLAYGGDSDSSACSHTDPNLTDRPKIGRRDGEVNLFRNDVMMFWSVCSVKRVQPEPTDA